MAQNSQQIKDVALLESKYRARCSEGLSANSRKGSRARSYDLPDISGCLEG